MTKIAFAAVSFLAFVGTARACPDMAGTWECRNSENQETSLAKVTQETIPGGVVYHGVDKDGSVTDWYADGNPRTVTYSDGATGLRTVTCGGDSVNAHDDVHDAEHRLDATLDFSYQRTGPATLLGSGRMVVRQDGKVISEHSTTASCVLR